MNCLVSHVNSGFREKGDAGEVKTDLCNLLCSDSVPEIVYGSIRFFIVYGAYKQITWKLYFASDLCLGFMGQLVMINKRWFR